VALMPRGCGPTSLPLLSWRGFAARRLPLARWPQPILRRRWQFRSSGDFLCRHPIRRSWIRMRT